MPPNRQRVDDYSDLIVALIHIDKVDEAQKWIDHAEKNLPDMTCMEYTTLAERESDLGDRQRAQKYAELAEQTYTDQYFAVLPRRARSIWNRLGQPARADFLQKKADAYYQQSQEQSKNAQQSPLKDVGF